MVRSLERDLASEGNNKTTDLFLLSDLKEFEVRQEKRLENAREKAEQGLSVARAELDTQSTKLK